MTSNSLLNLMNYSFPGVNILNISLVADNDPELPGYKLKNFCFIRLIPGSQSDSGGRTFAPKEAINFKIEPHKLLSLAKALKTYSNVAMRLSPNQQVPKIPAFTIFADSSKSAYGGQEKKSLNLGIGNFDKYGNPSIVMYFQAGQKKIVYSCDVYTGHGIGDVLEMIAKKAIELEFERVLTPQKTYSKSQPKMAAQSAPPQGIPTESPINNPINPDANNIDPNAQKALNSFGEVFNNPSSPFGDGDSPF